MKLESFRIHNCFGFVDSGEIDLNVPGNLVYFLGRNSSGKTSVLRALSYFEHGQVPKQHPNFENYERTTGLSLLLGRFSVNSSGGRTLSVDALINNVIQRFASTSLRIQQGDEGFSVEPSTAAAHRAAALLDYVYDVYSALVQRIVEGGQVSVAKLGSGTYQFFAKGDSPEDFQRRRDGITTRGQDLQTALTQAGSSRLAGLDFDTIEGLLFMQFPEIFVFTDRFSLNEDLPRALRQEHLKGGQNALTDAFVSLLGQETLRNLLKASRRERITSLTQELQGKLDALCSGINEDASRGAADADFVRMYVDRADAVRVILQVDGKESYYEHLSDNTKFLVAYHVFQNDRDRKNYLPAVLLFDEPNKGFHPSAEAKMLRFLESLAERGNQVLVTTHSQHMIDLDRLHAARIMVRADDGTLRLSNKLYGPSGASQDTLALQPVTDAIGLHYADQVVVRDRVVVVEGYTDMLYLRLFARLLGHNSANLAPMTGDSKIMTFLSFLISQGIFFKVALDSSEVKGKIKAAIPVPDDSFFVVEEHLARKAGKTIGIEDLLSKDDFKMLLQKCGHVTNEKHLSSVSNSEYAKSSGVKALVAREVYESTDLEKEAFSDETAENFRALLDFCENDRWFRT